VQQAQPQVLQQAQPAPQQPPAPAPAAPQPYQQQPVWAQQSRPAVHEVPTPGHVPTGSELEKYNEPAYLRRNAGINRGGYDITRRSEVKEQEEETYEELEQQKVRRQAAGDKPAFLRRIMD
jgi:hypothetical protein